MFAVGLIAGNVPEGLLPVITLALAIGVRDLVRRGAVVKRLSSVETLGSTDVICTDKTGTLTQNRMQVTRLWTSCGEAPPGSGRTAPVAAMAEVMAACNNAQLDGDTGPSAIPPRSRCCRRRPSPGINSTLAQRDQQRRGQFHFDPALKLMSTIDQRPGGLKVHTKGAPEAVSRGARPS